jgi:DHA2 family multidrug resistance protein
MSTAAATATTALHPDRAAFEDGVHATRWFILLGLITAAIMEVLDTTIVNVALPQIAGNLSAAREEVAWVSTSYILANVVVLPMTAFFTETFGRKRYLTFSSCYSWRRRSSAASRPA